MGGRPRQPRVADSCAQVALHLRPRLRPALAPRPLLRPRPAGQPRLAAPQARRQDHHHPVCPRQPEVGGFNVSCLVKGRLSV